LAIRAFDIQSGLRDAYERQREYMRTYFFMGKVNPGKISQRLQDLNNYLDYLPIERTTLTYKTKKAYGKSLPEDEILSHSLYVVFLVNAPKQNFVPSTTLKLHIWQGCKLY
jgi:hypothetical protein